MLLNKLQGENSALAFNRLNLNIAFVQHYNLFAQTKTDAAAAFFSTEERNENFIKQFFRHAAAVISNFQNYFFT